MAIDGSAGPRGRLALPALLLGSFMGVLDPFVVTVALPAIRSDLGVTAAQAQWIVAGYGAVYGTGLVLGGRLGDRYGRRRLFLSGMGAYVAASALAGTAPAAGVLVGARLAQGLAAAAVLPQVLSIIRTGYGGAERDRAPVLPRNLFAERRFAAGIVVVLLLYAAGAGAPLVFVLTHYVQDGLGLSPLEAGLAFAPLGIGFALASAVAPRLSRGGAAVPAAGAAVVACALGAVVLVAVAAPVERQPAFLAGALLVAGIGQGLAVNPVIALVLAVAPGSAAGASSGLLLTTTQVGNVLGVTGVGGVFLAVLPPNPPDAAAYGPALAWSSTMLVAATLAALAVVAGRLRA
jgi:MFS family permease